METRQMPYRGKLSAEQVVDGINAAIRNARRLAVDAKTMFERLRFPTAASLAILSIEESGKVRILRGIAVSPDKKTLDGYWKDYRNHKKKNAAWIALDLIEEGARDLDSLSPVMDPNAKHPEELERDKQNSLYTDYLGNGHWNEPSEKISKEKACSLVDRAESMANEKMMTLQEMELWIKHLRPVWGGPEECAKEALVKFYKAMEKEGLYEEGNISPEDFIFGIEENGS